MFSRRRFLSTLSRTAPLAAAGCAGITNNQQTPPPQTPNEPTPPPPPPPPPTTPPDPPPPDPPSTAGSLKSIEHVIFTMQENRSFDHYFGKMPEYRRMKGYPGEVDGWPANASNPAADDPTQQVLPYHFKTQCHENLPPGWNESHVQWNRGTPSSPVAKLNGFVYAAARYSQREGLQDVAGVRAMGYYDWNDLPYYYELASQFPTSDRYFCSLPASTLANRLYLLGGSSFGRALSNFPEGAQYRHDTIFDLCEKHGISWRIYVNGEFTYYNWFIGSNRHRDDGKIAPAEQFFSDVSSGTLPQVVLIESGTSTGYDEHPRNNIQRGVAFIKQYFDAVMNSPLWLKSAMFLTYDEHGGFYDHVVPPAAVKPDNIEPILPPEAVPGAFDRYGFRVPFIMMSPWAKKHYVSHQVADHTSILKFIETRFELPSLTQRDAAAHDLLDMFDFSQMQFEHPPALPAQPTDGVCRYELVAA
ncbi:MAG: phospholipase C [Candidatus Korobacteraceae bacterium]